MEEDESQLEELLSMLAIATVCDVVDLTGENRIFVKEGLRRIKDTQNIGLKALLNVHDLMDKQIQSYALGFIVGPCINAETPLANRVWHQPRFVAVEAGSNVMHEGA